MDAPLQRARLLRIHLSAPTHIRSTTLPRRRMSRVAPSAADRTHARVHADSARARHRRPHWIHFPVGRSCVVLPLPYQAWVPPRSRFWSRLSPVWGPASISHFIHLHSAQPTREKRSTAKVRHSPQKFLFANARVDPQSLSLRTRAQRIKRCARATAVDRLRRHCDSRFKRRRNVCDHQRRRGVQ